MSEIVVIGSINMDLVVRAPRMPEAGETLAGSDFQFVPGGKGANQAVAAARMGGAKQDKLVSMVGCVGPDVFGAQLRESLLQEGVDTEHVRIEARSRTGVATIVVDDTGENRIITVAGANGHLSQPDLSNAAPLITAARVVVMQFEIPLDTVAQGIALARQSRATMLLNPAPAYSVPLDFFHGVDVLVMNESESARLTNIAVHDQKTAQIAAAVLHEIGVGIVVFTLGAKGAVYSYKGVVECISGFPVQAVDTTAAGDAFVGALAVGLAQNIPVRSAVKQANAAGALAVTRLGAQPSLPYRHEVIEFMKLQLQ